MLINKKISSSILADITNLQQNNDRTASI